MKLAIAPALLLACASAAGCSSTPGPTSTSCSQAESALKVCPATVGSIVQGIDVSTYQGTIAWAQVKAAGKGFAFARISDGTTHPDVEFANNWVGMKAAGVVRGSYQYFRASEDPTLQANLVASSLAGAGGLQPGDLPVVMDIETADGQTASTVQAHMTTWLDAITTATGRPPIIYTNAASTAFIGTAFSTYALWVANWTTSCPTMPGGWSAWNVWQYSDTGSVAGVTSAVDLDEFDGTLADLLSFAAGGGDSGLSFVAGSGDGGANTSADASARDAVAGNGSGDAATGSPSIDSGGPAPVAIDGGAPSYAGASMGAGSSGPAQPPRCGN